jgi:hypothetical protein
MMVLLIVVVFLVHLPEEDELGTLFHVGHPHRAPHASVWVVPVEVADEAEALLGRVQGDEVLRGEAVVADRGVGVIHLMFVILMRHFERQTKLGKSWEGWGCLDSRHSERNGIGLCVRAVVPNHVTNKRVASLRRQFAVMLVLPVATVLDFIAHKQSTDALRVCASAVVQVSIRAHVDFEQLDAMLENATLDVVARVQSDVELLVDLVESVREFVESGVEFVILGAVLFVFFENRRVFNGLIVIITVLAIVLVAVLVIVMMIALMIIILLVVIIMIVLFVVIIAIVLLMVIVMIVLFVMIVVIVLVALLVVVIIIILVLMVSFVMVLLVVARFV